MEILQIDAFTDEPFKGNPAAVCLLEEEPPTPWMQSMAEEMNLSETAFTWPDRGGWRLRWFTPAREVRLCGHATLAAAHALWETGRAGPSVPEIAFDTLAGTLEVTRGSTSPAYGLALPRIDSTPLEDPELAEMAGTRELFETVGPGDPDVIAPLDSASAVRSFDPDLDLLREKRVGLIVTAAAREEDDVDFVSRYFAPYWGIPEDPVTGSAHAALFPFWEARLDRAGLRARQVSARSGVLWGRTGGKTVRIRGDAVTVFRARVFPFGDRELS